MNVDIFNLNGDKISTLSSHYQKSGSYQMSWKTPADLSDGIYLLRVNTVSEKGVENANLKILLMR